MALLSPACFILSCTHLESNTEMQNLKKLETKMSFHRNYCYHQQKILRKYKSHTSHLKPWSVPLNSILFCLTLTMVNYELYTIPTKTCLTGPYTEKLLEQETCSLSKRWNSDARVNQTFIKMETGIFLQKFLQIIISGWNKF